MQRREAMLFAGTESWCPIRRWASSLRARNATSSLRFLSTRGDRNRLQRNRNHRVGGIAESTGQKSRKKSASETKGGKTRGEHADERSSDADEMRLADPIERPTSDLSKLKFDNSRSSKRVLPKDKRKRCLKCGGLIKEKERCKSCGHLEQSFDKATKPLNEIDVQLAGFQLWFVTTMSEGISFRILALVSHILMGVLGCLLAVLAIFGVGGFSGVLMLVILGLCTALYVAFVVKGHQLASDPHATLAWFQKPLWNLVLHLARKMNWQNYDERFKGRKIIDCRGEGLTDDKIPQLEGLGLCQVLDLEQTLVTDAGLRHLYGLPNLYCVVLRKTRVTDEGVFRLQQTKPRLWIWY